ncbi:MAG: aminopeptidase P family N-terminal domain-containing protein, partial [Spirochaetota bacterium]
MIARRLQELRKLLKRENLSAYIMIGTDPHQSEYVCDRWKGRQFISGFSGSAGTVVVTESEAGLWTDSRYYLQAERELSSTEFIVFKQGLPDVPEISDYISNTLDPGCRVGIAANEVTMTLFREMRDKLQPKGIILEAVSD